MLIISDILDWLRGALTYLVSGAPYPLRVMFWVILFLGMGTLVSLFFGFQNACTTDGQLYQPDSVADGIAIQIERVKLSNGINYTLVNSSFDPLPEATILERVETAWYYSFPWGRDDTCVVGGVLFHGCNSSNTAYIERVTFWDAQTAREYDIYIRDRATLKDIEEETVLGVTCSHQNAHLSFLGIDVMNKELWLVLTVILIIFPLLVYGLNKRR